MKLRFGLTAVDEVIKTLKLLARPGSLDKRLGKGEIETIVSG